MNIIYCTICSVCVSNRSHRQFLQQEICYYLSYYVTAFSILLKSYFPCTARRISCAIFWNVRDFWASFAALMCLILAHLLCPALRLISVRLSTSSPILLMRTISFIRYILQKHLLDKHGRPEWM